jgi:hypothetical protein
MKGAALVVALLLWPLVARAEVINPYAATVTFGSPALAATRDCAPDGNPQPGRAYRAPLQLVETEGLRIDFHNPIGAQNMYDCDPFTPVYPSDWTSPTSPWRPLLLDDDGLRPMTIWAADDGWLRVASAGAAIAGFTFNAFGFGSLAGGPCSAGLLVNHVTLEACSGLDQFHAFAAPVYTFDVALRWVGSNPALQLVAIEVPEPSALALLGVGLLWHRRRSRFTTTGKRGA